MSGEKLLEPRNWLNLKNSIALHTNFKNFNFFHRTRDGVGWLWWFHRHKWNYSWIAVCFDTISHVRFRILFSVRSGIEWGIFEFYYGSVHKGVLIGDSALQWGDRKFKLLTCSGISMFLEWKGVVRWFRSW